MLIVIDTVSAVAQRGARAGNPTQIVAPWELFADKDSVGHAVAEGFAWQREVEHERAMIAVVDGRFHIVMDSGVAAGHGLPSRHDEVAGTQIGRDHHPACSRILFIVSTHREVHRLHEILLIEMRQKLNHPAQVITLWHGTNGTGRIDAARRKDVVSGLVVVYRQSDLLEIVHAL